MKSYPPELKAQIHKSIEQDPSTMPAMMAAQLKSPEACIVMALPENMRTFADPKKFDDIWAEMTSWEKTTFICQTPGAVIEIKGKLPRGKHGHGYFNLMEKDNPLGGHLRIDNLGSICFLEKPFFGLESLSVQFYDKAGDNLFAVYAGREKRKLIQSVKESFIELRAKVSVQQNCESQ